MGSLIFSFLLPGGLSEPVLQGGVKKRHFLARVFALQPLAHSMQGRLAPGHRSMWFLFCTLPDLMLPALKAEASHSYVTEKCWTKF